MTHAELRLKASEVSLKFDGTVYIVDMSQWIEVWYRSPNEMKARLVRDLNADEAAAFLGGMRAAAALTT